MNKPAKHDVSIKHSDPLEVLWDDLLSRKPARIRRAFDSLDPSTRKAILAHLQRMMTDSDWQPEQRASAKAAIRVLETQLNQDK